MRCLLRCTILVLIAATADAILANKIRISLSTTNDTALCLSQVVVSDENGTNIAAGRPCNATSYYDFKDSRNESTCEMALDGVLQPRDDPDIYYHSEFTGGDEYWEVLLQGPVEVESVTIYNRDGYNSTWLAGAEIEVFDQNDMSIWSKILSDRENQTITFEDVTATVVVDNSTTIMIPETEIPDTEIPDTAEPVNLTTSAPVITPIPFPDPVPLEDPVAPILQETSNDDSIWVVLGVFVAVICFGMMTAVVFAGRHWFTSKKQSKEMKQVADRLRDTNNQQDDLSKKLAIVKEHQETYRSPNWESNRQNEDLTKLQSESQAHQQQYEENVKELTSEIRELERKVADLVNTQQTTDNKIHDITAESTALREKAVAAAEAAVQEKQLELSKMNTMPQTQQSTNGPAPINNQPNQQVGVGSLNLTSPVVGISSLESVASPLQSQTALGASPLMGSLRSTGLKSSLFSTGTQPFSQFSPESSISAPLLGNVSNTPGLVSTGTTLQHGVSRGSEPYVPPNPLRLDTFGLPVVPPPDTPLPPQLWVYQQQVNPDIHKRKHAFHVYKKRSIQIVHSPQGHVLEVSAKRNDGTQECDERIPISLIDSVSGDGTTMPELNIALLIETKKNQRFVFIVSTETDRVAWLQWFTRMYPMTRSTDVPVS
eukprot:TRINITY_DN21063_c0_g1_i1.p1 TRINITY_DN21063_c0_g1~~TRINITY_DN21063_c0_g1_i1.p1  ORF type:complete len:657 (+),score=144.32 TRINITY_DN21063_c0_g1_i1:86-2056(+)